MSNKLIINNKIIYDSRLSCLYDIDDPDNKIPLTTPANDCLAIILRNSPEITSQKKIFEEVWERYSAPINANTFYQNISMIRRAFKKVGINEEVIVTVPRRGVCLSGDISVEKFTPNDDSDFIEVETPSLVRKEEMLAINHVINEPKEIVLKTSLISRFFNGNHLIIFSFILVSLISVLASYFYLYSKNIFYNYDYQFDFKSCQIYSPGKKTDILEKHITKTINELGISCDNNDRIYFNAFIGLPRESVIVCDDNILSSNTNCSSYYRYLIKDWDHA